MSDQPDHLSYEVALEAKLDATGVSAKAKSRTVAAIDRLIGGLIDVPAAYVDGKAARVRAKSEVEVMLIREEGKAAIAGLYNDPDLGARVANRIVREETRKQLNREAIAEKTIEHLKGSDEPEPADGDIDEDWLNVFEAEAEKASGDRLRDLWARVLSGEIRKPGSFSLATLRFLAELDGEIAQTFDKYVSDRISDRELVQPKDRSGVVLQELAFLETVGLLLGALDDIGKTIPVNEDGLAFYPMENFCLRLKSGKKKLRFPVIYITRIGREVISILPPVGPVSALKQIAARLSDDVEEAIIFRVGEQLGSDVFALHQIEKIK